MILTGTGTIQSEFVPPVLDAVAGSQVAAFSVRKLRSAYAGSAIRVRRSSDNAQSDIGFDASGNLDISALTTFIGSGNAGRIVTWYDQTGNGRNLTNSSTTTQPVIVDSSLGVIYNNGRPTLSFANYGLEGTSQWFSYGDLYASVVVDARNTNLQGIITSRNAGYDNSPAMYYSAGPNPSIASTFGSCGGYTNANQIVHSAQWDASVSSYHWVNGVLQAGPCTNGAYSNTGLYTAVGTLRYGDAYSNLFYLQEILVFNTLMADNRQSSIIEANQAKYFSIQS